MENKLDIHELLQYEVYSSKIAPHISFIWAQKLIAQYYAWKVRRKYKRYSRRLEISALLNKYKKEEMFIRK